MSNSSKRGFASMDLDRQREIASRGGKAAHEKGTAHEFSADEARAAGRKGGLTVSANAAHMAEIGRQGGKARSAALKRHAADTAGAPSASPTHQPSHHRTDEVNPTNLLHGHRETQDARQDILVSTGESRPDNPGANA